jgi:predicted alpha/beta hydrolase family esterase
VAGVLTLPGWQGSGPGHWQTRWGAIHEAVEEVAQDDWETPDCADWIDRLDAAVERSGAATVLVGHSMGCILAARWAVLRCGAVRGALLVAVPDPDGVAFPREATGFDLPMALLPFPTIVVSSSDDPYATPEFSQAVAAAWGSELVELGPRGHINADSGLGEWEDGWALVTRLRGRL